MSIIEEIRERSKTLSEPLAKEVLDFLLFVSSRQVPSTAQEPFSYTSLKGTWKGRLSSSDALAKAKAEEKELEL
jgi:hypothetical protein